MQLRFDQVAIVTPAGELGRSYARCWRRVARPCWSMDEGVSLPLIFSKDGETHGLILVG